MSTLSVGSVLRQSKFSRFDPKLPQIYGKSKFGEWGCKAPIPSKLPAKYLNFQTLDSIYNIPFLKVGDHKVNAIERLKEQITFVEGENFLESTFDPKKPFDALRETDRKFIKFLKTIEPENVTELASAENARKQRDLLSRVGNQAKPVQGPIYTSLEKPSIQTFSRDFMPTSSPLQKQYVYGHATNFGSQRLVSVSGLVARCAAEVRSRKLAKYEVEDIVTDSHGRLKLHLKLPAEEAAKRANYMRGVYRDRPQTAPESMYSVEQSANRLLNGEQLTSPGSSSSK